MIRLSNSLTSVFVFFGLSLNGFCEDASTFRIEWENDTFLNELLGIGDYDDRHYTNGVAFQWMGADGEQGWITNVLDRIWPLGMEVERTRSGFGFGHQMYTPEIISTDTRYAVGTSPTANLLQVNDRPYAGYLFMEALWERRGEASFFGMIKLPARDRFEMTFGLVGPGAAGHAVQRTWHKIFIGPQPDGWSNQLNNEIALNVHADRTWLFSSDNGGQGPYVDLMPSVGMDLGNVSTRLTAGLEMRLGAGQIHDFLLPSIERNSGDSGVYFFVSVDAWLVGQNIFLDGNTFSDSHEVEKNSFVTETKVGFGMKAGFGDLDVAWVKRSEEFEIQSEADTYLSASFTYRY
ncbi:lipid A deacylase LpxR family protein [Akkermansiaceae bacterium]|nr:lipid A deacylase LpxR family protein [Akkermansiaceae bacterium]